MNFFKWLEGRSLGKEKIEISAKDIEAYIDTDEETKIYAKEFFIAVATNIIAGIYSAAEVRSYMNGKEVKQGEYYLWNYQPNVNQSASEFKKELIDKLINKNEVLIVEEAGQLIIADNFIQEDITPLPKRFRNVNKGNWNSPKDYQVSDVIYIKLNNKNIKEQIASVDEGYRKITMNALENYELANGRKGTMHIDATAQAKRYGEKSFNEVYTDLLNNRFKRYFKSKNAVLPLFEGFEYEEKGEGKSQKEDYIADYIKTINEQAAKTALAFNISPKLLVGDIEGLKDAVDNTIMLCVKPLIKQIDESINRARYGKKVLEGCYVRTDISSIRYIDIFSVAEKVDKLIASGFASIDELRRMTSIEAVGIEETQKHYITKNYEKIEEMEGGKENA